MEGRKQILQISGVLLAQDFIKKVRSEVREYDPQADCQQERYRPFEATKQEVVEDKARGNNE